MRLLIYGCASALQGFTDWAIFPEHPIIGSPDPGSFDTLSKPFKIDEYFPSQAPVFVWRLIQCRSGGIGRRAWFRSMYSQGCGGSSPFFGTNPFLYSFSRRCEALPAALKRQESLHDKETSGQGSSARTQKRSRWPLAARSGLPGLLRVPALQCWVGIPASCDASR